MTHLFQHGLLNQPFGDPALYVRLAGEKKALLVDLGNVSCLSAGALLRVDDVFVTHTHIDHFIGFDHLLRLNLARGRTLRIFGPPGIIRNVRGKLAGYTWNLTAEYPFALEAIEIGRGDLRKVRFECSRRFRAGQTERAACDGTLLDVHPHYSVSCLRLDHGIASMAYRLEERFHININKNSLERLGLPVGPWLRELKNAIWEERPDHYQVLVDTGKRAALGRLRQEILTITRGQKIAYVTDCRGTAANMKKIVSFVAGADMLYCEAAFLDRDRGKALERGHLTARQAGCIARQAGCADLRVFHFSPRYEAEADLVYREAQEAFKARGDGPG